MKIYLKTPNKNVGEVYVYDQIGSNGWGEGISAKDFANAVKSLGDVTAINLYINSAGGSVFDAVAMQSTLQRHPAQKMVFIDGLAASAASVLAMVGNEITIAENGMVMIHNPWVVARGEAEDLRKIANNLDTVRESAAQTYATRSGQTIEQIREWMDAETWMSGQEAVERGFADRLSAPVEIAAMANLDLADFRNAPALSLPDEPQKPQQNSLIPRAEARLARLRSTERNALNAF